MILSCIFIVLLGLLQIHESSSARMSEHSIDYCTCYYYYLMVLNVPSTRRRSRHEAELKH